MPDAFNNIPVPDSFKEKSVDKSIDSTDNSARSSPLRKISPALTWSRFKKFSKKVSFRQPISAANTARVSVHSGQLLKRKLSISGMKSSSLDDGSGRNAAQQRRRESCDTFGTSETEMNRRERLLRRMQCSDDDNPTTAHNDDDMLL